LIRFDHGASSTYTWFNYRCD